MARRSSPEVNAGSMADIAFLLLIFFLVTTTIETDSGISRKLPPMEESEEDVVIKQKNIFTVLLNGKDQLLVEDELMILEDLRESAIEFLDNGGGTGEDACTYCKGKKDPKSSDNPDKAIISLKNERETSYATYISVQNELVAAYTHLRNIRAQELYGESYSEMMKNYKDVNWPGNRERLKENINRLRKEYPQKLSEVNIIFHMSKFNKKKKGDLPAVNTASLPDIVFMLLFFFMVVTVMREDNKLVKNKLPDANQVEKLDKKNPISYIYMGEPSSGYINNSSSESENLKVDRIQLNDKLASLEEIAIFISSERAALREETVPFLTVSLKVDKNTNMGIVDDVKQELRKVNALKINYTTGQKEDVLSNMN